MITLHLIVKGKVQGVFYRASAKEKAKKLGVNGWVKNTEEGNVEIVCEAAEDKIIDFVNWCKSGPGSAKVESIDVNEIEPGNFNGFEIIRKH